MARRSRARRRVTISALEIDDVNTEHLAGHRVEMRELREVISNRYIVTHNARKPAARVRVIGKTDGGRLLAISLEETSDETTWRPVTARDATAGETTLYRSRA